MNHIYRDMVIGAAAWVALMLAAAFLFEAPARAQTRHDADQAWIRKTIREKDRQALEKHYGMPVEIVRRPRTVHRDRHYYDRWREARRDDRDRHHHSHEHRETRVYGFVQRMTQQDRRDCHNGCCPPKK